MSPPSGFHQAIPGNKGRVLEDMGPLVRQAIAKICAHHDDKVALAACTPEERAAYDAWLQPRIWELAGRMAETWVFDTRGSDGDRQRDVQHYAPVP